MRSYRQIIMVNGVMIMEKPLYTTEASASKLRISTSYHEIQQLHVHE